MSSVQYDVRKVCGRPEGVPQSGAIPYSGLDDVTIRGLALATLRHRKTPIRRRSYVLGNQPVQELLHLSHYCRMWASVAVWRGAGRTVASNPGGIEANLFGLNRLVEDVGNELVRGLRIVPVVIAAQCKIHCLFYQR